MSIGHEDKNGGLASHDSWSIVFLAGIVALATLATFLLWHWMEFPHGVTFLAIVWLAGFAVLFLNIAYLVAVTVVYLSLKDRRIAEVDGLDPSCRAAILYVVKNEAAQLFENIGLTINENRERVAGVWLLSNSDNPACVAYEHHVIQELRQRFPDLPILASGTPDNPLGRKHIAIQHWLRTHSEVEYFVPCDADSRLGPGTVNQLLRKAEHPSNRNIAVFQSHLAVDRCPTRFVRWFRAAQNIAQRLYIGANQRVFGRAAFFGSGALIRCRAFAQLEVPSWVLSHDIWDTVGLERQGNRVVYCNDVTTYEDYPQDYCDSIARDASSPW